MSCHSKFLNFRVAKIFPVPNVPSDWLPYYPTGILVTIEQIIKIIEHMRIFREGFTKRHERVISKKILKGIRYF